MKLLTDKPRLTCPKCGQTGDETKGQKGFQLHYREEFTDAVTALPIDGGHALSGDSEYMGSTAIELECLDCEVDPFFPLPEGFEFVSAEGIAYREARKAIRHHDEDAGQPTEVVALRNALRGVRANLEKMQRDVKGATPGPGRGLNPEMVLNMLGDTITPVIAALDPPKEEAL